MFVYLETYENKLIISVTTITNNNYVQLMNTSENDSVGQFACKMFCMGILWES